MPARGCAHVYSSGMWKAQRRVSAWLVNIWHWLAKRQCTVCLTRSVDDRCGSSYVGLITLMMVSEIYASGVVCQDHALTTLYEHVPRPRWDLRCCHWTRYVDIDNIEQYTTDQCRRQS
jgi:hypothetical protein